MLRKMKAKGEVDKKTCEFLVIPKPGPGRFYLLPKIHKRSYDVPGRPVISNNSTPTENISAFIDHHLKEIPPKIPNILEDTRDFLNRIEELGDIPEDSILVSFDVVGLYPSIPHDEGIEYMHEMLQQHSTSKVSAESLCELAELILTNNFFEFGDKIYHQKLGTAMGTKFAPQYANIFMAGLEKRMLNDAAYTIYLWWRFLDDIFTIWTHGMEALNEFFEYINTYHPYIKFTMKIMEDNKLDFLDALLEKVGRKIKTDLYSKEVDTHQYLHASSCHPIHCKNTIAYGQALRLKRICSEPEVLEKRLEELKGWLTRRGYLEKNITSGINRATQKSRSDLLQKQQKQQDQEQPITLVLTYHPALKNIRQILQNVQRYINKSPALRKILPTPPRVAFRNDVSIRGTLVRAKLPPVEPEMRGCFPCGDKRCGIDGVLHPGMTFTDKSGEFVYNINHHFDCNSTNVVYLLSCKVCSLQYIGSTTAKKFRLRFNKYKSDISLYGQGRRGFKQERFIAHFHHGNHSGTFNDLQVQIIDYCDPNNQERRESFWIYTLKTMYPDGWNCKEAIHRD